MKPSEPRLCAAIFAHPDDEVLGCGGALALHAAGGHRVRVLLLSTGMAARGGADARAIETLRDQARRAAEVLGVEAVEFADFPDNAMDGVPLLDVVRRVEDFLSSFPAATVYTHHGGDLNVDHRVTSQAVVTACRPLPGCGDRTLLACEVNSSTEWSTPPLAPFSPSEYLNIGATLETKVKALECYAGEVRAAPHPRSAEGLRRLASWRGAQAGLPAAEAFATLRRIRSRVAEDGA